MVGYNELWNVFFFVTVVLRIVLGRWMVAHQTPCSLGCILTNKCFCQYLFFLLQIFVKFIECIQSQALNQAYDNEAMMLTLSEKRLVQLRVSVCFFLSKLSSLLELM